MSLIAWNMTSYDTVRAEILARAAEGLGYDYDGSYGYQCWDLGANWYGNVGRQFRTENSYTGTGGLASGVCTTWLYTPAYQYNSTSPFTAVSLNNIKRGDMIIWNRGRYSWDTNGHNGFADEDYIPGMASIRTLGQNQINPSATVGHIPSLTSMSTNLILGAFRYTLWNGQGPGPGPQPGPPAGITMKSPETNILILRRGLQNKQL